MKKHRTKQITMARAVPESETRPSRAEVAKRAHEIFLARGGTPGQELDDWLQAERELTQERASMFAGDNRHNRHDKSQNNYRE